MTGKPVLELEDHASAFICFVSAVFSPDGKRVLTASGETVKVWDAMTGQLLVEFKGHAISLEFAIFSPDEIRVLTTNEGKTSKVWDTMTGKLLVELKGHTGWVNSAVFSPDGQRVLTANEGNTAKVWNALTGQLLVELKGHTFRVNSAVFSPDGQRALTASWEGMAKVWDARTGQPLFDLKGHTFRVNSAVFSPDGQRVLTASWDKTAKVWDAQTGKLLVELKGHTSFVNSAIFSPDGKRVLTVSWDGIAKVWDALTGQLLVDLKDHTNDVNSAVFNPDGQRVLTASKDKTAKVWDAQTGKLLVDLKGHTDDVIAAVFSADGKRVLTASGDNTAKVWDALTGQLLAELKEHTSALKSAVFSPNGKQVLTASKDNTCKLWNIENNQLLYTFMAIDSTDYLVVDKDGRYDGTENARKLIYYVCNDEVVELEQFKELGWEPNLVAKIMGVNKDPIKAKGIYELDICGRVPNVEEKGKKQDFYQFQITPGKGGVGDVLVFVNQKLIKTIPAHRLSKQGNLYQVAIAEKEVTDYFVKGQSNTVSIKAKTTDNSLQSRGAEVISLAQGQAIEIPHLYIVSVGVSKYKGERLNLNFAGKDAREFSGAMAGAARALFNTDGQEHVTVYTLNSEPNSQPPFKQDIKRVFETVKAKATPNDG